ncbi:MAG: AAA family ATPase [Verrucomicrobia bacterium]|nr:AAA family ATPase [Verrucomicrobiota bacterium]
MSKRGLHLKRIELWGFKSFADRTSFEFDEGVSGIVGPNGCGKSNVADAFRWVMGEQSAKSLRGERMQDVIFAGTAKRKSASFAQVTLTFSGAADNIVLSRRLDRSGESEYRLNGNVVRLKEIHSLFLDSGMGKEAYAIFEQGRMDEIIFRSPEERRPIFEQAAGIHRYRKQWKEAEAKLTEVEFNCSRVADVLGEVAKQLKVLEKQVAETKKFKAHQERLQTLEQGLIVAKWKSSEVQRGRAIGELNALQEQLEGGKRAQEALGEALGTVQQKALQRQKQLQGATEELYRLRSQKEVKAVEERSSHKRLQELEGRQKKLHEEAGRLEAQLVAWRQERIEKEKQGSSFQETLQQFRHALDEAKRQVENLEKQCASKRELVEKVQRLRLERMEETHLLQTRLKEEQIRFESATAQLGAISSQLERVDGKCKMLQGSNGSAEIQLQELIHKSNEAKKGWKSTEEELHAIALEFEQGQKSFEQAKMDLADAVASMRLLRRLSEEQEGLSAAAKALLKEQKFQGKVRALYEGVEVPEGMAAVMRPYEGTLLVEEEATLREIWEYAEAQGLKGFSILCKQGKLKVSDFGSIAPLSLEEFFTKSSGLTERGDYRDCNGVLFSSTTEALSLFTREAELKKLTQRIAAKEGEKEQWLQKTEQLKGLKQQLLDRRAVQEREHRLIEMKQVEVNFGLQQGKKELQEQQLHHERLDKELKQLTHKSQELESSKAKLSKAVEEAEERLKGEHLSSVDVEVQLKEQLIVLERAKREKGAAEESYRKVEQEEKGLSTHLSVLSAKEEEYLVQQKRIGEETQGLSASSKELQAHQELLRQEIAFLENAFQEGQKRCQELQKEVNLEKEEVAKVEKQTRQGEGLAQQLQAKMHRLEVLLATYTAQQTAQEEELLERFSLPLDQVRDKDFHLPSLEEAEKELKQLKQTLEGAQTVNLGAIEEHQACQERYQHLSKQMEDLDRSRKELQKIIEELDKLSKEQFLTTFEQVRESFKRQFQILFNGGEADLQFVGSEDPLEAGIDLIAKPPGKKMRSIKLLSGGEKCLTAMALLFALFEVKPAPFCLFDEIDAPLDDANVGRFLDLLRSFREQTQVIIITHNKLTMAQADVLYGITMEEQGVSKQIAMKFEPKRELALV